MPFGAMDSWLDGQNATLYVGVGVLSLAKAVALGRKNRRTRRELRDAVVFLGSGLLLWGLKRRRRRTTTENSGSADDSEIEGADGDHVRGMLTTDRLSDRVRGRIAEFRT